MRTLVLASASPARRAVLTAAGLAPEIRVSGVNETATSSANIPDLVRELAAAKAQAVASRVTDGLVLGCDSLLSFEGRALGKPRDAEQASAWWQQRAGKDGELLTGHCLLDVRSAGVVGRTGAVASTTVHFGSPTAEETAAYVASAEPLHVAGAFTIEGRGAAFLRGITGDYTNVLGVSVPLLRELLGELGVALTELWT